MSTEKLKALRGIRKSIKDIEEWNALPDGPKYMNDSFAISLAHCQKPKLVRAGQQSCGGSNYWDSPELFNELLIEYVKNNMNTIYDDIMFMAKEREKTALIKCQDFVNKMQADIDAVTTDKG